MKKIILLLALVFVMRGCDFPSNITDYGVVEGVELYETTKISTNYTTKYRVRVSSDFNANWPSCVYLYTNTLYTLGDTIQVIKKN